MWAAFCAMSGLKGRPRRLAGMQLGGGGVREVGDGGGGVGEGEGRGEEEEGARGLYQ